MKTTITEKSFKALAEDFRAFGLLKGKKAGMRWLELETKGKRLNALQDKSGLVFGIYDPDHSGHLYVLDLVDCTPKQRKALYKVAQAYLCGLVNLAWI